MNTEIRQKLGIEFPIFAFTHCRDVVAAVTNAGGIGVLGAIGFTPEQLEVELTWIDEHVGDKPYGVDIVIPAKYEGMDEMDPDKLEAQIRGPGAAPAQGVRPQDPGRPPRPRDPRGRSGRSNGMIGWTAAHAAGLLTVALRHPNVKLIANALGTPPPDVVERVQGAGLMIGALAGSVKHALNHKAAGLDFIICQGSEGGGHTGDVGSIVLWPEVVDAVAPIPVLAAGGVGSGRQMAAALALGAQGVWSGTLWLTVEEADIPPKQMETYLAASSRDTDPVPVVHRQAVPDAQERLDRRLGGRGHPRSAAHAAPDDGGHRGGVPGPPLPRTGQGRELQPLRTGHRAGHHGPEGQGRRLLDGRGVPRGHRAAAGRGGRLIRPGMSSSQVFSLICRSISGR